MRAIARNTGFTIVQPIGLVTDGSRMRPNFLEVVRM
jgi:hypothetical protein